LKELDGEEFTKCRIQGEDGEMVSNALLEGYFDLSI
jgi:hypothetical protein